MMRSPGVKATAPAVKEFPTARRQTNTGPIFGTIQESARAHKPTATGFTAIPKMIGWRNDNSTPKIRKRYTETFMRCRVESVQRKGFSSIRLEDVTRETRADTRSVLLALKYKLELFGDIFSGALDDIHTAMHGVLHSDITPQARN